jgi:hypothetical protein
MAGVRPAPAPVATQPTSPGSQAVGAAPPRIQVLGKVADLPRTGARGRPPGRLEAPPSSAPGAGPGHHCPRAPGRAALPGQARSRLPEPQPHPAVITTL